MSNFQKTPNVSTRGENSLKILKLSLYKPSTFWRINEVINTYILKIYVIWEGGGVYLEYCL